MVSRLNYHTKSLCDWVRNAALVLQPLAELQKSLVLQSPILWTDDTPVTVLGGKEPGSSKGRFWVYIGDSQHPYSVYDFTMVRARDGPAAFLKDYRSTTMSRSGRCDSRQLVAKIPWRSPVRAR